MRSATDKVNAHYDQYLVQRIAWLCSGAMQLLNQSWGHSAASLGDQWETCDCQFQFQCIYYCACVVCVSVVFVVLNFIYFFMYLSSICCIAMHCLNLSYKNHYHLFAKVGGAKVGGASVGLTRTITIYLAIYVTFNHPTP